MARLQPPRSIGLAAWPLTRRLLYSTLLKTTGIAFAPLSSPLCWCRAWRARAPLGTRMGMEWLLILTPPFIWPPRRLAFCILGSGVTSASGSSPACPAPPPTTAPRAPPCCAPLARTAPSPPPTPRPAPLAPGPPLLALPLAPLAHSARLALFQQRAPFPARHVHRGHLTRAWASPFACFAPWAPGLAPRALPTALHARSARLGVSQ